MKTKQNRKHTLEDKLQIVRMHEEGYSYRHLSSFTGISHSQIESWLRRYRKLGLSGLEKHSCRRLSDEVKAEIVSEIRKKSLSLQSTSIVYGVSCSALSGWRKKFLSSGLSVFTPVCSSGCSNKPMGRPKKKPPQSELEKLQVENLELKAEIAYLKKVRALVETRENYARAIVPESSKD
jgi:transposase